MNDYEYIVFEDYLSGTLSPEDADNFEARLQEDLEFKQHFETYKELHSFLEHKFEDNSKKGTFEANLKRISDTHFNTADTTSKKTEKKRKLFRLSHLVVAASVVILIGVFIFNQFQDPTYSDFADYDTISLTVRGSDNELFTRAEQAFNAKKYKEAELLFNQILSKDATNLEVALYKSITLIETGRFSEADELLVCLSETNSAFNNNAKWYWALSKLKQKDFEACAKILKTIPVRADDYDQAQKLLSKLD